MLSLSLSISCRFFVPRIFLRVVWARSLKYGYIVMTIHRVDRVPGFLSSRPNWVCPPRHPQASVAPPTHLVPEHTLACGKGGGRGPRTLSDPVRTKGQTLWYSRYCIIPPRYNCTVYRHPSPPTQYPRQLTQAEWLTFLPFS